MSCLISKLLQFYKNVSNDTNIRSWSIVKKTQKLHYHLSWMELFNNAYGRNGSGGGGYSLYDPILNHVIVLVLNFKLGL